MNNKHGALLKKFRQLAGFNQSALGKKIGVSKDVISNWERGKTEINTTYLDALCDALGIKAEDLMDIKNNPAEPLLAADVIIPDTDKILSRYYMLDDHGKQIVQSILDIEYHRVRHSQPERAIIFPMMDVNLSDGFVETISLDYYPQAAGMGRGQDVGTPFPEKMEIPVDKIPPYTDFVIRVTGDSMEPTFYSGDILFIQSTNVLNNGDIGVFNLNGEALVKEKRDDELISHNSKYPPIKGVEGCYIQGRVVGKYEK